MLLAFMAGIRKLCLIVKENHQDKNGNKKEFKDLQKWTSVLQKFRLPDMPHL